MGGCMVGPWRYPGGEGPGRAYLACALGEVLLTTLECSLRVLRSPILVVSSLLLGIWYSSCSPAATRSRAACG